MSIPTWKPKQFEGCLDFSEDNLDAALAKIKEIFLEYDGVVTLRRSGGQLNFGAVLHEREEKRLLATQSDSV